MEDQELVELARKAREFSYSPYSKFKVGAALITNEGKVYSGCNIENASFGLSNCAERTAFFKAISEGKKTFERLVVTGETDAPISPCGACRQVMVEFCEPTMPVLLVGDEGALKETTVGELLPYSFNGKDL